MSLFDRRFFSLLHSFTNESHFLANNDLAKFLHRCRSYEDCCGTRCCVRALSIQRLWYFWLLLMMGVFFCCGAGFFIRRRMYPSALSEEPAFNVSFTRQPVSSPGQRHTIRPSSPSYHHTIITITTSSPSHHHNIVITITPSSPSHHHHHHNIITITPSSPSHHHHHHTIIV
ncbi:vesicular, overexpressed in cancer, prosurvival protein 1-like [Sinocyclocheilus grahami]|uniref:vesicular, overexpressed in cancer, prosurvival protein 1-like n=1 Tax=Sinocyclocheilus grahami TaxID=75366 RepID=UPI0007AC8B9D|nr:PREDICTED: vesicular, overexpressed in cancer, prosurvival protein 1-like [Sinocyclocheilus grahami]